MAQSNLRPASFRSVPFGVSSHELQSGRRTVEHNFPGKDDAYVEDMGRKTRKFTIEAFVVGAEYQAQRDNLLAALEKAGPGKLVHPFLGERTGQVSDISLKETWDEGGMAKFTFTFAESGKVEYPVTGVDKVAGAASSAKALDDAAVNMADSIIKTPNTITTENLLDSMKAVTATIQKEVSTALGKYNAVTSGIDKFTRDVNNFSLGLQDIIMKPGEMFLQTQDLLRRLSGIANPLDCVDSYRRILKGITDQFASKKYTASATGQTSAKNDAAVKALVKSACVAATAENLSAGGGEGQKATTESATASGAMANTGFDSRQQAEALRDEVMGWSDEVAADVSDDEVFQRLTDVKIAVYQSVPPEGVTLRDLRAATILETVPALVLAHRLYGSVDLADDIIARNRVRHPGQVPGGVQLEVLS